MVAQVCTVLVEGGEVIANGFSDDRNGYVEAFGVFQICLFQACCSCMESLLWFAATNTFETKPNWFQQHRSVRLVLFTLAYAGMGRLMLETIRKNSLIGSLTFRIVGMGIYVTERKALNGLLGQTIR